MKYERNFVSDLSEYQMKSQQPAIVEIYRGPAVESVHAASLVVCDQDGSTVIEMGQVQRLVFPRSAIKSFQALALVGSGAAEKYGFTPPQIALACSSHNGEIIHTTAATAMLEKSGLSCGDLECGCQNPLYGRATEELFRSGKPSEPVHNNCSGKHAGFLAFAQHIGVKTPGYIKPDHPVQLEIAAILEQLTDSAHNADNRAIDGCSIPTYAIPLKNIAIAAARFASQTGMSKSKAQAARHILNACSDHPEMVAGSERACTQIMEVTGRRASVKMGAEGVYVAMYPDLGLGAALKVHDGNSRGAESLIAEVSRTLLRLNGPSDLALETIANPILKNHNGIEIGEISISTESRNAIENIVL